MMNLINDPRTWAYNRLNPVTLRPTIQFLTGRDNMGRQQTKAKFAQEYARQLTPIPVQKLFTTPEDSWADSLFTSAGLASGTYRSPLEKMAHDLRMANIPDKPEDEDKQDEQRRNVQTVQKLRKLGGQGPAYDAAVEDLHKQVQAGKMTAREAMAVVERAQMSELQYDVLHLGLEDAMKVYAKADGQEKEELKPVLEAKRARDLKNYPEAKAERIDTGLKQLGIGNE
jgi:hypothetical protein